MTRPEADIVSHADEGDHPLSAVAQLAVPPSALRRYCDPASFDFDTTAELEPHVGLIGQDRAVEAIRLGLSIESEGFNICVSGEPGTGRSTAVREYLEEFGERKPPPDEWCYVHNFDDPYMPKAIRLPRSRGVAFKTSMAAMVTDARERIPLTFQSEDFVKRRDEIIRSVQRRHEAVFSELTDKTRAQGFLLQSSPAGFFLVPLAGDQPLDDQGFSALPAEERERLLRTRDQLMEALRVVTQQEQSFEKTAHESLAELERSMATSIVDALLHELFDQFKDVPAIIDYLTEVRRSMIENIEEFLPRPQVPEGLLPTPSARDPLAVLRKYAVNLLADSSTKTHAPVVFEPNPTPQHLFGRIEKEAFFGAVTTDFTMIRPGSLHRANGGYLVVDFDDILLYPLSWNELKRTLRTGQVTIEELGDRLGFMETKTLRPQPIPWEGKVIVLAREAIYRILYHADPDFRDLFKVKADFDLHIDRSPEHERSYARVIAGVTQREGLPPFDRSGVARLIEEGARLADHQDKLSIRFGEFTDIVRESGYWAGRDGAAVVTAEHVRRALKGREYRVNLIEDHVREMAAKGITVFETDGNVVGQVNGLSVVDLGDTAFGQPSRITASIGVGREGIVDLQRESELAGPIHSKAVLTLRGFLLNRYAGRQPLSLTASMAFEQSYGIVEGDSATCAEVCALLSVLAAVPMKQSLAITGSMDQRGLVQAVGGTNQKIEGFFDVCRIAGLTGAQGVIVPAANLQHLMLREDVLEAVEQGTFHIYAVSTIDEALELLTDVPAGTRDDTGDYPSGSLNQRVLLRLRELGATLREFGEPGRDGVKAS
jgi:lon-related putative ATP-dependent protease